MINDRRIQTLDYLPANSSLADKHGSCDDIVNWIKPRLNLINQVNGTHVEDRHIQLAELGFHIVHIDDEISFSNYPVLKYCGLIGAPNYRLRLNLYSSVINYNGDSIPFYVFPDRGKGHYDWRRIVESELKDSLVSLMSNALEWTL